MKNVKMSQKLTESGLMLALATILSVVRIAELPYGGSITFASMLPLIILSFRYDFLWGALSGFVFGLIQLLLGMNNLSYATSLLAAIAIILLDYVLAFMSTSVGAFFKSVKSGARALMWGALLTCVIRYLFHVISGCTVWAGLSIPTTDAFVYSLIYNATYMIPETILTVVMGYYLGSMLDFTQPTLRPAKAGESAAAPKILGAVSGLIAVAAVAAVVAIIFPALQNADTGEFDITGIAAVNLTALGVIVGAAIAAVIVLQVIRVSLKKKSAEV